MIKEKSFSDSLKRAKSELNALQRIVSFVINSSRNCLDQSSERIVQTTIETTGKINNYVHKNPWQSIGMGTIVGVFIGFIISRSHDE